MRLAKILYKALVLGRKELASYVQGETCDHSVGICYCETFRVLQEMDEALAMGIKLKESP